MADVHPSDRAREGRPVDETSSAGTPGLSRRRFFQAAGLAAAGGGLAGAIVPAGLAAVPRPLPADGRFAVRFEDGALASLKRVGDVIDTEYVEPGERLGDVQLRFRRGGGAWRSLETGAEGAVRRAATGADGRSHTMIVAGAGPGDPEVEVRLVAEEEALRWGVTVRNPSDRPLEVGDLALPLPVNLNRRRRGQDVEGPPVLKHGLVAGDGSFIYWMRSNSVGPFLTLMVDPGTKLEYWESEGGYRVFVHSAAAGAVAAERGTEWRQPNTALTLAPGESRTYGLTFRWADDYEHVRALLVEHGLIDVHVVPGMTVPVDLSARFALRTKEPVHGVDAEHPGQTELRSLGRRRDAHLWEARFARLGENRLTIHFGDGRSMVLELFVTEPLETLIRKRGAFIAGHQFRDPSLWYDGLLAEWANDTHVMLGPDNYDRIRGWRIYEVTCDDPGLSKPAFLAAKNAEHPVQAEVEALDHYIESFVWGGLQRTTEETFSYGIYGIPDWKRNRDSEDAGRNGRQHLWRIYDYPHVTLTYLGLYRVARNHPHIGTAMAAEQYLRRAYGTALAMFTVPWEIERWSAYGTGLMNDLVVEDVITALYAEGMRDEAERLRPHWERKVRTFVVDRPDLFRSEYAFDTTGFESTHALAKYALRVAQPGAGPDREVRPGWEDYPSPTEISLEDAREFMETQMAANLFCRGWLETAYYLLGSDIRGSGGNGYTLTYMSQMGGWSVLDYALHHAADPAPYLRLGYASYLSAWALMNSGTPESDYGYWYPGPESDGAAGGGFEPAPYGETWLEQPHTRGSWYYSCEIDLGYCGALRCARTVLADDPLFGRIAYGGEWRPGRDGIEVEPRDGLRRRFHAMLDGGRLHLESEVDRFAAGRPLVVAEDASTVRFELESDNPAAHVARVRFAGPSAGTWEVRQEGGAPRHFDLEEGGTRVVEVPVGEGGRAAAVTISRV